MGRPFSSIIRRQSARDGDGSRCCPGQYLVPKTRRWQSARARVLGRRNLLHNTPETMGEMPRRFRSRSTVFQLSALSRIRRAPSRAISSSWDRPSTSSCTGSLPTTFSMGAASFPPRALGRRSIMREDTPLASRAPRSTTSGHTSQIFLDAFSQSDI